MDNFAFVLFHFIQPGVGTISGVMEVRYGPASFRSTYN